VKWISLRMPDDALRKIDQLVEEGRFPSRSEAIREFIVQGLIREDAGKTGKLTYYPTARQK